MVVVSPASAVGSRIAVRVTTHGIAEIIHHVIRHTFPGISETLFHIQFALLGMGFENLFYGIGSGILVAFGNGVITSSLAVIRT